VELFQAALHKLFAELPESRASSKGCKTGDPNGAPNALIRSPVILG
jgi:hypothetical protein